MFNNDSWLKYQEKIGLKIKALEELMLATSNQYLTKGMTLTKGQWSASRYNNTRMLQNKFVAQAKLTANEINKIATEGLKYALKTSSKDIVMTDKVKLAQKQVLTSNIKRMQDNISKDLSVLITTATQDYRAIIPEIQLDNRELFKAINDKMTKKSDLGYYVTKSGRKMNFKSYMEMAVRTEMQNNALENLEASSKAAGIEVYLASAHGDCADDHVEFQGLYYLADGVVWRDEFEKYDFHPQYKYLSEVKALGFLTRPNCRHYVQPITLSQLGDKGLAKKLGMPNEKASKKQYQDLKQQRYNERNIRKYKSRANTNKVALKNAPKEFKGDLQAKIASDNKKVREWQKTQRSLINKSGLKRDYGRENPGIVVNDLGVRRSKKL